MINILAAMTIKFLVRHVGSLVRSRKIKKVNIHFDRFEEVILYMNIKSKAV